MRGWPLLISVLFTPALALAQGPDEEARGVFINELMYHPSPRLGTPDDYQWIELYNGLPSKMDLSGWRLNDFELPAGTHMAPNGYLVVARQDVSDPDQDGDYYSAYYNADNGYPHHQARIVDAKGADLGLRSSGETIITLVTAEGRGVDRAHYSPRQGGNGDGPSLEKTLAPAGEKERFWRPSVGKLVFGTGGQQNSTVAIQMRTELDRFEFERGDVLVMRTHLSNRTEWPAFGVLDTYYLDPTEREFSLESGREFTVEPKTRIEVVQQWVIPPGAPLGDAKLKQVTGDAAYSVATEFVEFTVGTLDVGGGAQASGF